MTVKKAVQLCSESAVLVGLVDKNHDQMIGTVRIIAKQSSWFGLKQEQPAAVEELPELAAARFCAFLPSIYERKYGPAVYMVAVATTEQIKAIRAALELGRFTGEYETEEGMVYTGWAKN